MIEIFRRTEALPRRLGILAGTFNPPTRAHVALAGAALCEVDEVLFVLPRILPHKEYQGASFDERIEMLQRIAAAEPRFAIAATDRGLFIEIAQACRHAYGENTALVFICGRDAAERIVNWDYGHPDAFARMLDVFELLVASRAGDYEPPAVMRQRIHRLLLPSNFDHISATFVRERVRRGESWEELVPAEIVPLVREIYLR